MICKYNDYLCLLNERNENYSNKQKTFWFTEIVKNSLETMINIYVTSIYHIPTFSFNLEDEKLFLMKIKEKANKIINIIKKNDKKSIKDIDQILNLNIGNHQQEKYNEFKNKILQIFDFWNANYISFFGSRGIGKTLHFQNTIINYQNEIIGISKENFDEIYSKEFEDSFFIKLRDSNTKMLLIDALNQTITKENEFIDFIKKVLVFSHKQKIKIITITPYKVIEYPFFINLFTKKEFAFFTLYNKLSNSEKEIIYKNCDEFDKELMKFLISTLDDNPRSAILLKKSMNSLNKKANQKEKRRIRNDWSIIKYLRLLTEYYIKITDSKNSNFKISKESWEWLKKNANLIFYKKCYLNNQDYQILNYLKEINVIDVEFSKIEMKDKLFFVLLFVYTNLNNNTNSYKEFKKISIKAFYQKDLSLLISLSGIYIFEKWRRSKGLEKINELIQDSINSFKKIKNDKNFNNKIKDLNNPNKFEIINLGKIKNSILKNIANLMILDLVETKTEFYLSTTKNILSENKKIFNYADINILLMVLTITNPDYEDSYNELCNKLVTFFNFKQFKKSFFIYQNSKINILINFLETILKLDFQINTPKLNNHILLIIKKIFYSFDKNMLQIIKSLIISKEIKNETLVLNLFSNLLKSDIEKVVFTSKYNDNKGYKNIIVYIYYSLLINIYSDIKTSSQKNFLEPRLNFILKEICEYAEKLNLKNSFSFLRTIYLNSSKYNENSFYFFNEKQENIKKSTESIAKLNSYFFNKNTMNFLNFKFFTVFEYDEYISTETLSFLNTITNKFSELFPTEKVYNINLFPKIQYTFKPHSMTYKDWIIVMLMDKEASFKEKDAEIKINDFGKSILKDEITAENPLNYNVPITYDILEEKDFGDFKKLTNDLLINFKKDKRNLFLKSKNSSLYGLWFVLIKVQNKLGTNWKVSQNPSGLNNFSFESNENMFDDSITEPTILKEIKGDSFSFDVIFDDEKLNNSLNYDFSPGAWYGRNYEWFSHTLYYENKWYKSTFKNEELISISTESKTLIKSKFEVENNIYCYFESSSKPYMRRWIGIKEIDNQEIIILNKIQFFDKEKNLDE